MWKAAAEDIAVELASWLLPEGVEDAWDPSSFGIKPVIYAGYRKASGDGHVVVNYEKVLRVGLKGILSEINEALARLDRADREAPAKQLFLKSAATCIEAAISFAKRYSAAARELAREESNPERKRELLEIAGSAPVLKTCPHLPRSSPVSLVCPHAALAGEQWSFRGPGQDGSVLCIPIMKPIAGKAS